MKKPINEDDLMVDITILPFGEIPEGHRERGVRFALCIYCYSPICTSASNPKSWDYVFHHVQMPVGLTVMVAGHVKNDVSPDDDLAYLLFVTPHRCLRTLDGLSRDDIDAIWRKATKKARKWATAKPCTRCGAVAGSPCIDMRPGQSRFMTGIHELRIPAKFQNFDQAKSTFFVNEAAKQRSKIDKKREKEKEIVKDSVYTRHIAKDLPETVGCLCGWESEKAASAMHREEMWAEHLDQMIAEEGQ